MELDIKKGKVKNVEGFKKVSQTIKAENMGHMSWIVSDRLYTDKILAVCREYMANATDAHKRENRCPNKPIDIQVPTNVEPVFKVRDYGEGLSDEMIENIYIHLGDSTKRGSNDEAGCFGIGNMSFRAYTDSFNVVSWHNGIKTVWSIQEEEDRTVSGYKIHEEKSDEPSGVEISVAVNSRDMYEFVKKIGYLVKHMTVKPNVLNHTFNHEEPILKGKNWKTYSMEPSGYASQSIVLMGDIPYKISIDSFEMPSDIKSIIKDEIVVSFDLGEIDISPDRERIDGGTKKTQNGVIKKFREVIKDINQHFFNKISQEKDYLEFVKLYKEMGQFKTFSQRDKSLDKPFDNGFEFEPYIESVYGDGVSDDVLVSVIPYVRKYGSHKIRKTLKHHVLSYEPFVLVIHDTKKSVSKHMQEIGNYQKCSVFVVIKEDNPNFKKFMDTYHVDTWSGQNIIRTSDYPFFEEKASSVTRDRIARKGVKYFSFNASPNYTNRNDDFWENVEEEELSEGTKYYIPINRFSFFIKGENVKPKDNVSDILKIQSIIGAEKIYGIKKSDVENLDSDWVSVEKYFKDNVDELLLNKNLVQHRIDNAEFRDYKSNLYFEKLGSIDFPKGSEEKEAVDFFLNYTEKKTLPVNNYHVYAFLGFYDEIKQLNELIENTKPNKEIKEKYDIISGFSDLINYVAKDYSFRLTGGVLDDINDFVKWKIEKSK
jgi:hypothetical protein